MILKEISIPLTINDVKKNKALCKKPRTTDARCTCQKVRKSQKQNMVSSVLPKNELWDNFQYIKLSKCSFLKELRTP